MVKYFEKAKVMSSWKDGVISIIRVPREDNAQVDFLSKLTTTNLTDLLIDVWIEVLD
jgi:hypothetical protein